MRTLHYTQCARLSFKKGCVPGSARPLERVPPERVRLSAQVLSALPLQREQYSATDLSANHFSAKLYLGHLSAKLYLGACRVRVFKYPLSLHIHHIDLTNQDGTYSIQDT